MMAVRAVAPNNSDGVRLARTLLDVIVPDDTFLILNRLRGAEEMKKSVLVRVLVEVVN